ncbi:SpoIIE family protein phosphatase [Pseudofrankia inefficax]|uniref:Putative PAS/PAC sensor protein n=1 Tax=Pseudofrankia inefficax (strain DSM 45817 / CECT 9037 / DDB 130130 / EuI1c) TaxID=298654 RepID=E3JDC8_PSEI1|nr:SpoIIE family protein phosphatase [Pseudofrankia inefficax]ADP83561.1 putative PAS/PAC sensor protein [Pseudofrankia inefficax]
MNERPQVWGSQTDGVGRGVGDLYRALTALGVGIFDWDVATDRMFYDQAAARLLGFGDRPGSVSPQDAMATVHPDDRPALIRARDAALRNENTFLEEYRVVSTDGSVTWVQTRARLLREGPDGRARVIGLCTDRTPDRTVRDRVARALDHMGDIVLVLDETDTIVHANIQAIRQFELPRDDMVGKPAADLLLPPVREHVAAIRRRRTEPTTEESRPEPVLEIEATDPDGAWWAVRTFPIPDGLVVAMRNVDARHRADAERKALIGSLSSALRRSRQLLDATVELGQVMTVDELCDVAAHAAQADLGVLFVGLVLLEEDGPPRVHCRPNSRFLTEAWRRMPAFGPASTDQVLRTGRPRFDNDRKSYLRDYPDRGPNLDAMSIDALASLPLIVSGRPIGLMVLGWPEPQAFEEDERRFLLTLVGPFAQALERARLYERQMSTVETLQRAVLPQTLPDLGGVRLAARYLPAGRDLGIGGDWYDATMLSDGTLSLVVGDVGGHGLRAVSTMAELRHAARAYALQLRTPADITTQLSANLGSRSDEMLATAVVADLCPATGLLNWSCAGHPPPLLVRAAAGVGASFLEQVNGPILGVDAGASYGQNSLQLEPGDQLLLFTDGLVERRGRSLTTQLAALAEAAVTVPAVYRNDPDGLCDHILHAVAPVDREDDLCLLAVAMT